MPESARRHALHDFCASLPAEAPHDPGVILRPIPFGTFVNLRGDARDAAFLAAVQNVTGNPLPVEPNRFARGDPTVCWTGPDEWLVIGDPGSDTLVTRFHSSTAALHAAATDVSGGNMLLELAGPRARDVLAQGCTVDLHPQQFAPGQCAQTGLARSGVLLLAWTDAPAYRIVVRRSFADYVARWLTDAAAEYGVSWVPG